MSRSLQFLTRAGCHLCAEALPVVEAVVARMGDALEIVDVDDSGLADDYGDRVPVVLFEGRELISGRFDRRDLERVLG